MSRAEFANDRWHFVFGVDHFCGPFVQVWDRQTSEDETGRPDVAVDRFGVRVRSQTTLDACPRLARLVREIQQRWEIAVRLLKISRPNLDVLTVCRFAEALSFGEDAKRKVYELWD